MADPDIGLVLRKTNLSDLAHVKASASSEGFGDAAMLSHDLAGTPVLVSMAPIESLNWRVFVEQPVSEVYAKLNASILRTGLLLLSGLVISALGALALARGMVRPIRTLSDGAQRIGEGNLDQRIDVRTGDELETLADRFNRMSSQLKESYAGLERKVDERTRELTNSLEQQMAISEILRVISNSPTNVQPVLDAVAERAAHLCSAPFSRVMLVVGNTLQPVAEHWKAAQSETEREMLTTPVPLKRTSLTGRAALDRKTIHLADVVPMLDSEFPGAVENMRKFRCRAVLAVPLMREGGAYGGIFIARHEPGLFPPDQVALVQTFADQAAIAIDNVRLFNETKEALDQQRASVEVLAAISNSIADTTPCLRYDPCQLRTAVRRQACGDRPHRRRRTRAPRRVSRPEPGRGAPRLSARRRYDECHRHGYRDARRRAFREFRWGSGGCANRFPRLRHPGRDRRADDMGRQGNRRRSGSHVTTPPRSRTRISHCSRPFPTRR